MLFQQLRQGVEVIAGLHTGAEPEFVVHQSGHIVDVIFPHACALGRRKQAVGGVVGALIRFPAVVRPEHQGDLPGEYVPAHQQAGVILHTEEVGEGGQNVQAVNRLLHLQVHVFQAAAPDDQSVAVPGKAIHFLHAVELADVVRRVLPGGAALQTVGVVVRTDDNDGIVGDACVFQLLDQRGHGLFQLQLGSQIALDGLHIVQVLYQIIVFSGLGVFLQAVAAVTGHRHVVDAEGLMVDVLGHGHIDHFQIAFRPDWGDALQTAVAGIEVIIAQMGMGFVPVVEVGVVIVVGGGKIAQLLQLVSQLLSLLFSYLYPR